MLPDFLCKLTMLKHLDLSFCVKLEHLPSYIGDLKLQIVGLEGCFFLGDLPDSIFSMSTLVYVQRTLFSMHIQSQVDELREKLNLRELTEQEFMEEVVIYGARLWNLRRHPGIICI